MSRAPNGHRSGSYPNTATMSRAERFEDEKRRIIESCFSKVDTNGQLMESYITHIRITEDALHPSSPPPPDSDPANKKPRLIIVAVRSTGRVRMHKARENNNGSFSIGKTWNMEDLSCIETFSGGGLLPPSSERDARHREWAGNVGFTVTITKPYYWQAGTAKEKDFFIASCVKIFRKYTKGLVPDMKGFAEQERAMILGQAAATQPQQAQRQISGSSPAPVTYSSPPPPTDMSAASLAEDGSGRNRDGSQYRQSPGPPPSIGSDRRPSESPGPVPRYSKSPANAPYGQVPRHPGAATGSDRVSSPPISREATPGGLRPGLNPGSAAALAAPPPLSTQGRASSSHSSSSQMRPHSPGKSSRTSTDTRSVSPAQSRVIQREKVPQSSQDSQIHPVENGHASNPAGVGTFYASVLGQTRARVLQQQTREVSQDLVSPTGAPVLPPIETDQPTGVALDTAKESEASSAGFDINDAAAVSTLTGFWGPDQTSLTPRATPKIDEPGSPPTPERSKRRPPLSNSQSNESNDLRLPPIGVAASGGRSPFDDVSRYTTPLDGRSAIPSPQNVGTPGQEEPPAIPRPLFGRQQTDKSETSLKIPGAFGSPLKSSPLATPLEEAPKPLTPPQVSQIPLDKAEGFSQLQTTVKAAEMTDSTRPSSGDPGVPSPPPETSDPNFRPGLGPMIKKKGAAERFRTAARAANAFKPRPGGAAEKILKLKAEREASGTLEGDGISGVFKPTPKVEVAKKPLEDAVVKPVEPSPTDLKARAQAVTDAPPKVEVTSPVSPTAARDEALAALDGSSARGTQLHDSDPGKRPEPPQSDSRALDEDGLEKRNVRTPRGKIRRRSFQQERYIAELGIDRSLVDGKGLDFEMILSGFGWSATAAKPKQVAELESDIKREIGRVEAGMWVFENDNSREERVALVDSLLDKAIAECDELEGLLTLYSVELGSLNDDIAFIEAQSQGLQVQSANQKLLHTELQSLLDTVSLDRQTLDPLRYGDLADGSSIENLEGSLAKLYTAMITIEPGIRSGLAADGRPRSRGGFGSQNELGQMLALQEKRGAYKRECAQFCQRLMHHLDLTFDAALNGAKDDLMRTASTAGAIGLTSGMKRIDKDTLTTMRGGLWVYSPLILFAKELNPPAWQTLLRMYHQRARPVYESSFKEDIEGLKRVVRRPTGEEADVLFTTLEKDNADASGITSTARKMTVKRTQTLAKTFRQAGAGDRSSPMENRPGGPMSSEVFASVMDELAPLISQEQNFIVDMFHATSLETGDFIDAVSAFRPGERRGTNLSAGRHVEPDREIARQLANAMEEIFGFFTTQARTLLEWAIGNDPMQGVGVMASLSKHAYYLGSQNQSQEWLLQLIDNLVTHLQVLFAKFVEEQVHAIEDTKVKIKKRKGVIGFIKVFPNFSTVIENTFAAVAGHDYETNQESTGDVRRLIDDAYARINRSMFDSMKVIAKEGPMQQAPGAQKAVGQIDDPEDKEMLNYQILIIENMNHYIEEVDDGGHGGVLAEWKERAERERREAMDAYVSRVIRRPLGKLLEYLDAADAIRNSARGSEGPLSTRPNYNRKAMRHLLAQYDSREIRRGCDVLRRRIEKHFGDANDEATSRQLVTLMVKECEAAYEATLDRVQRLIKEAYPPAEGEKAVDVEFNKGDIQMGFRR